MIREDERQSVDLGESADRDLVDAMAAGDARALEVLYDRYAGAVFSFAVRIVGDRLIAEEVLQEVFLKAWRQAAMFSGSRGTFITWILSITHNMAIDEIRKQNRRPKRADSSDPMLLLSNIMDGNASVEDQVIHRSLGDHISRAMAALPDAQRAAIELAYFQGLTEREIAAVQGEPLGTIKTRMRLAIRKLREHLENQGILSP